MNKLLHEMFIKNKITSIISISGILLTIVYTFVIYTSFSDIKKPELHYTIIASLILLTVILPYFIIKFKMKSEEKKDSKLKEIISKEYDKEPDIKIIREDKNIERIVIFNGHEKMTINKVDNIIQNINTYLQQQKNKTSVTVNLPNITTEKNLVLITKGSIQEYTEYKNLMKFSELIRKPLPGHYPNIKIYKNENNEIEELTIHSEGDSISMIDEQSLTDRLNEIMLIPHKKWILVKRSKDITLFKTTPINNLNLELDDNESLPDTIINKSPITEENSNNNQTLTKEINENTDESIIINNDNTDELSIIDDNNTDESSIIEDNNIDESLIINDNNTDESLIVDDNNTDDSPIIIEDNIEEYKYNMIDDLFEDDEDEALPMVEGSSMSLSVGRVKSQPVLPQRLRDSNVSEEFVVNSYPGSTSVSSDFLDGLIRQKDEYFVVYSKIVAEVQDFVREFLYADVAEDSLSVEVLEDNFEFIVRTMNSDMWNSYYGKYDISLLKEVLFERVCYILNVVYGKDWLCADSLLKDGSVIFKKF